MNQFLSIEAKRASGQPPKTEQQSLTPLSDELEANRIAMRQERTPAYGDALALCRRLESLPDTALLAEELSSLTVAQERLCRKMTNDWMDGDDESPGTVIAKALALGLELGRHEVPDDWQLMPKEPTTNMLIKGWPETFAHTADAAERYADVLAIAPCFAEQG